MDAYTAALTLLARRELSAADIARRLARRGFDAEEINTTLARLRRDGTVDDRRVARAVARMEGAIRHRGRRRVLQKVIRAGVGEALAADAVDELFAEIDELALVRRAVERRLRGADPASLDERAVARIVRSLVGQGFAIADILACLGRRGHPPADD